MLSDSGVSDAACPGRTVGVVCAFAVAAIETAAKIETMECLFNG
jgi:hypothetical protein